MQQPAGRKTVCPTCKGAGKVHTVVNGKDSSLPCPTCKGDGTAGYGVKVMGPAGK